MTAETETTHPMVMKAARYLNKGRAALYGVSEENSWKLFSADFIARAHSTLTACGALECLEALEKARCALAFGSENVPELVMAYNDADAFIAKVYGSAT